MRDIPAAVPHTAEHWGSDAIAAMLRALDIPYLALNPGASYRGLHDSIVNYLGNERPQRLPCARTYINLDAALQESKIGALPPLPEVSRFARPDPVQPTPEALRRAAQLLGGARNPGILAGRVSRSLDGWKARVALAEKLQAKVFTDIKTPAAFPTDHPLHAAPPATFPDGKVLRECDVILSLDWVDTAGTLKAAWGEQPIGAKVIRVSMDAHIHRGWSADYQALPPSDVYLMCTPDVAVPLLVEAVKARPAAVQPKSEPSWPEDTAGPARGPA